MIHPPMPFADYNDLPGLRSSHLRALAESPLHYLRPKPRKGDSVELRLIHCLALEGREAAEAQYLRCDGSRATKEYKTLAAANPGRDIATSAEWMRAEAAADALHEHPRIGPLLDTGHAEVTVTWTRPDGRACKARFDWLTFRDIGGTMTAILPDLKTYGSTQAHHVARRANQLGAYLQAAHYREGLVQGYGWSGPVMQGLIVAEGHEPHDCELFWFTDDAIESATAAREALIERLAECERTGIWPGRHDEAQQLHPPPTYTDDLDLTDIPEED